MENATIIYLINSTEESLKEIKESISMLKDNFLRDFSYPITIFREKNFKKEWEIEIEKIYDNIHFSLVEFKIPAINSHLDIPEFTPHPTHGEGPIAWGHPGFNLGYRHMCRFMSGDIFRNSEISKYEWYWRLDTDSFILEKIGFDVFSKMKNEGFFYGFNNIQDDNPKVVEGLFEESKKYMDTKGITPKNEVIYPKIYYTNFEICNIEWFNKSGYIEYFDYLDSIGGIYTKRWGDAPIRYIGVNNFMENRNILDFSNLIKYKHGCFREFEIFLNYKK
jgi:alpha 1,2-mannosyltransferase